MTDLLALIVLLAGCFFIFAGTVGMLRLPDVYCRLHAMTKADNLGLLLICLSLALLFASLVHDCSSQVCGNFNSVALS